MFMREGDLIVAALEGTDYQVKAFTGAVNAGLTTDHLFTGSFPMRPIDVADRWRKERESGDILFALNAVGGEREGEVRFVGTAGLHGHREIYRSWEFRILVFDPVAVGRGLGKIAVKLITDYAFKRLNAHRIWLGVSEDNLRAVKCYLDCGFRFEGRLVDELYYDGKYHSALRMGMVK